MTPLVFFISLGLFVWCLVLTYQLYRLRHAYLITLKKTGKTSIDEALHTIVHNDEKFEHILSSLQNDSDQFTENLKAAVTRVGIVKFDPFGRSGGDQSFIISLLDSSKSGLLITCMYTREGIRLFPKLVRGGKGIDQEVSVEERKAIDSARILSTTKTDIGE